MEPDQTARPQTVGIRELKQNPSEIIAKAASGVRFEVLSNGKPVGVVIQRQAGVRSRWVSTEALVAVFAAARPGLVGRASLGDNTGWAEERRAERQREREHDSDQIVDPWGIGLQAEAGEVPQ